MLKTLTYVIASLLNILALCAAAQSDLTPLQQKIAAVMQMEHRTQAERNRDANRDPVNALTFMGLRDDMKVVELIPADQAYYTKILGPLLAEKGQLYTIDSPQTFSRWSKLLEDPQFKSVHKIPVDLPYNRSEGRYELGELTLDFHDADLFLNIREYHNFNAADKVRLNKIVYDSLKPGGAYVIIDHSRRHMQPEIRSLVRREDPVKVILEVQAAGFVFEKQSDMFFKPNDGLNLEVSDRSVTGQTDRFFFVFRKPG